MGFYIDGAGNYHEGEQLPDDLPVPRRPDPSYVWDSAAAIWIPGPEQRAAALVAQLRQIDIDAQRSARAVLVQLVEGRQLIELDPADVQRIRTFELQAQALRAQLKGS